MKYGLILGSGGARGFAHIGILKVLDEIAFPVHVLAGSSMGALIGSLYATGMKAMELEERLLAMDWKKWFRLADLAIPKIGFLKGDRIEDFLRNLVGDLKFEELKIPFAVTCTDLESGDCIVLDRGSVIEAVRASISVPGAFQPKQCNGNYLVDGGLSAPVPVGLAIKMGAEKTIAVDVTTHVKVLPKKVAGKGFSLYDTLLRSLYIMERRIAELTVAEAAPDILLTPNQSRIQLFEFHKAREAIQQGEDCARAHLNEILALQEA